MEPSDPQPHPPDPHLINDEIELNTSIFSTTKAEKHEAITVRHGIEPHIDQNNDLSSFLVSYRDLSVSYMLNPSRTSNAILQLPQDIVNNLRYYVLRQDYVKSQFFRLAPTSGYFVQGESTLILSPPGSGRTTLPKLCAQALLPTEGDLWYNGLSAQEAKDIYHIDAKKFTAFVEQVDSHFSEMTVYETLEFAHRLLTPHPSHAYLMKLIEAFGMLECKDNLTCRISGGQGRRLSLMLGLCNPHVKFVAMDNLSDGLDHAMTLDIVTYMTKWCRLNHAVFVATLQQPAPSVVNLFDKLILLRDGHTVYNGPTNEVDSFIGAMGYPSNKDGLPLPEHIIHVLSHPKIAIQENQQQRAKDQSQSNVPNLSNVPPTLDGARQSRTRKRKTVETSYGTMVPALYPCIELEEMIEFYHASPFYRHIQQVLDKIESARLNQGLPKTKGMKKREMAKENASLTQSSPQQTDVFPSSSPIKNAEVTHKNEITRDPLPTGQLQPLKTDATLSFYKSGFTVSLFQLLTLVLSRQIKLTVRNHTQLIARIIPAILLSFVPAGLYFQLPQTEYSFRVASFIDVTTQLAYNNLMELGLLIYYRRLIHSQLNLYPTWIYTTSIFIANIPYSLVEAFFITLIPYSMIGNSSYGWSVVLHFCILWIHGLVISSFFRLGACMTANTSMAYAVIAPAVAVLYLVAGFYVRADNLPDWVIWIYWISPFSWSFRSMAQLEFLSPRYDYLLPNPDDVGSVIRAGNLYLKLLDIKEDPIWILMSAFYCVFVIALFLFLSSWFLYAPNKEYSIGTRRFDLGEDENVVLATNDGQDFDEFSVMEQFTDVCPVNASESPIMGPEGGAEMSRLDLPDIYEDQNGNGAVAGADNGKLTSKNSHGSVSRQGAQSSRSRFAGGNDMLHTLTNELPFTPVTLSFESIKFTVNAKDETGHNYDRVLLQNITGYAQQGTLMALIGSSGAGKSTLANTLMGLNKTNSTQQADGTMFINGLPVDGKSITPTQFTSLTAYVEQFDTLYPYDTVYETLLFSARSRLRGVSEDILQRVVQEVMEVLELAQARDLMIGSPDAPVLSPAQIKRVNIGVELVANPSIIFLDEPTTGLDAEAAASVVRALHNIARSGRAIVCTIHQPSSQLFFHFDSLLLLGSGGFPLFFGRIGKWAKTMVGYFSSVGGFEPFQGNSNPAEWLVEEVSKPIPPGMVSEASRQFAEYQDSIRALAAKNDQGDGFNIDQFKEILALDFPSLSPRTQWVVYLHMCYMKSNLWGRALDVLSVNLPGNNKIAMYHQQFQANHSGHSHLSTSHRNKSNQTTQDQSYGDDAVNRSALRSVNKSSKYSQAQPQMIQPTTIPDLPKQAILPLYRQLWELTRRSAHLYVRSSSMFQTRVWACLILSLFFGVFYLKIDVNSPSNLIRFMAASVVSLCSGVYIIGTVCMPIYVALRQVWVREIFSNFYVPWLWPISFMINEAIWSIPLAALCFLPCYFLIGASTDPLVFFSYWLVVIVLTILLTQFSLALSMFLPRRYTEVVQNVYISLCFTFSNVAMTYPNINPFYKIVMRILPFFYLNRAITTQQFKHDTTPINIFVNDQSRTVPLNEWVTIFTGYHLDDNVYWWSILWLVVIALIFASISIFSSLVFRNRRP